MLPVTRAVATFGVLITLIAMPVVTWSAVNDLRGSDATAEVVDVTTDVPGRRVYTVRFVAESGQTCESEVDSGSNPPPRTVRVGGQARVHHSWRYPCRHVREADEPGPWIGAVVVLVLFGVSSTSAYRAWRRPPAARLSRPLSNRRDSR
jgi:hypothetical protein